jgi:hypothetical protein
LRACQQRDWASFVRQAAPPKPLLVGGLDYRRCLALAEASLSEPVVTSLSIVPIWACSTEDDVSSSWVAVQGVLQGEEPLSVQECGPFIAMHDASPRAEALWECSVRRWYAATVVESRAYAPTVPLRLRAGTFAVLDLHVFEVIAVNVRESTPLPRPTHQVPMFATWLEPRVTVPPDIESQIRALCYTSTDEGDPT